MATEVSRHNALARLSNWIDFTLSKFFYKLGHVIARHPWLFVVIPFLFMFGFFIRIMAASVDVETDPEDLYTPQDSEAFRQRIVVEEFFGFPNATNRLFFQRRDGAAVLSDQYTNAVNQAALIALSNVVATLYSTVKNDYTLAENCVRIFVADDNTTKSPCDFSSFLNVYGSPEDLDGLRTAIEADTAVMSTLQIALDNNAITSTIGKTLTLFDLAYSETPTLTSSPILVMEFGLINREKRVDGDLEEDDERKDWDVAAAKNVRGIDEGEFRSTPLFSGDVSTASDNAIDEDVGLLAPGYILLLAYSAYVLWRPNWVRSYASMAIISLAAVGLSIMGMYGFGVLVGIQYTLTVQAAFFLVLGLGADDTFVIMGAHRDMPPSLDASEHVARALARAGVSITITSLTDIIAFASGTMTALPAIEYFCVYAAFGVLFDFITQCTVFVAFLYWNTKREQNGRADFLSFWKPSHPERHCLKKKDFDPQQLCLLDRIMGEYLPNVILHPIGKACVMALAVGLLASSAWAATQTKSRFNVEWFVPDSAAVKDALSIQNDFFNGSPVLTAFYTGGIQDGQVLVDYTTVEVQASMDALLSDTLALDQIRDCDSAWWLSFRAFFEDDANVAPADRVTVDGVEYLAETAFYPALEDFLATDGSRFVSVIKRETSAPNRIVISSLRCYFNNLFKGDNQVAGMNNVRDIAVSYPQLGGNVYATNRGDAELPFAYSFQFLFYDGLAVIQEETLRNILIAGVAVAVVTLLLLANVMASLCVLIMLAMVDVNVLGFMYYVDVDFNSVSAVNLIIAVGLAIDSSVHIAHAFLGAQGTRDERAREALRKLGRSAVNGAVSTFLAIVLLSAAQSYIFQIFFKILSLIVLFALFHGVVVLPVVLSLIGPAAHPESEDFLKQLESAKELETRAQPTSSVDADADAAVETRSRVQVQSV